MRADLVAERQSYQGRDYWVIKDPVALKYFRFEEEEYALLEMLDGQNSPDRIKQRWDKSFAPQKITQQELFQFIGLLYRSSLLVSDSANQGVELKQRSDSNRKRQTTAALTNVLAVRFKGFDPDRFLGALNRVFGGFFSVPAFAFVACLALSAIGLVTVNWELFQNKLPHFQEFFAAKNWFLLAITLGFTKVFHEIGHGLACKRFGSQCHEMGVMLLVMTPCLYCNVSDSWTLPSKWKRAAIGAAGMYVEFFLASVATYVWWFSQPGIVNSLALNVMFVSSVSTLLFNANPLLRYDGYYILSDIIEVPNLRQKASTILQRAMTRWFLGISAQSDPFLPTRHKWFFGLYSIAAAVYRWFVTFAIFWFLYQVLEPYGLKILGQMIAMVALWGLFGMPMIQLFRFFKVPGRVASVKPVNVSFAIVVLLVICVGILMIPIPHYVHCSLYVQNQGSQKVYIDYPGSISTIHVQPNDRVEKGDILMTIRNDALMWEIADLETKVAEATERLGYYDYLSKLDPEVHKEIKPAQVNLDNLEILLGQKRSELELLVVRAPDSGVVMSPARKKPTPKDSGELGDWYGTPLAERNVGAYLLDGTIVCEIANAPTTGEAVLAIDQSDIEFVANGQDVKFLVDQIPEKTFYSAIEAISPIEIKQVPKALSSRFGGDLITTQSEDGTDRPQSTTYRVSVPVDTDVQILQGATGVAKIRTGSQTVGQRIWRVACETFRFQL